MSVFTLPSLGSDMEAGTLVEWLVRPGDTVHRGDVVAVIETQKGAIEIECFEEGTVETLLAETGQELPVGAPLARIRGRSEPVEVSAPEPAPRSEETPAVPRAAEVTSQKQRPVPSVSLSADVVAASPAARKRAAEAGIDLALVKGSFPGGRIVLSDVENAVIQSAQTGTGEQGFATGTMRDVIGAAMTKSKRTIPHFYLSHKIDVEPAVEWVAGRNESLPPAERILLGALFVRASVRAAEAVQEMNGHYLDRQFIPANGVNAGVAVALRGGGLVAPALMRADEMDLQQTMHGIRDLVSRARAGRLRNSEMTRGTITISSLGETGAEEMTGVIFPPQVALVCLGSPQKRPWVVDDAVVPRQIVTLTLCADHRVSDGRRAAQFIAEFATAISDPESL